MPGLIVDVHSLRRRIRFHCIDELLARTFEFARAEPEVAFGVPDIIDVKTVRDRNGFYDFVGEYAGQPGTPDHMLSRAHQILRDILIEEEPAAPILHAASVVAEGRRFIFLANKSTGKTTICLKCLAAGFRVEGDEHVAILETGVMSRARTLRIKQSSLGMVPELDDIIRNCPAIHDWNGDRIYSMAPRTVDGQWQIEEGDAHFLVFLSANHGGATTIRPMASDVAFESLLEMSFLPEHGRGAAVARLHRLTRQCQVVEMQLGDLDRAIWHLRQLARVKQLRN